MAPDFRPGDEITADSLNAWSEGAESGQVTVDGSSGLVGTSLPSGSGFRSQKRPEGWFTIQAAPGGSPSGSYQITEQVDLPLGAWATGVMVRLAYPTPGSATPPTGTSLIVRAWKDRASWRFEYGSC